jgi:hypothetical protein
LHGRRGDVSFGFGDRVVADRSSLATEFSPILTFWRSGCRLAQLLQVLDHSVDIDYLTGLVVCYIEHDTPVGPEDQFGVLQITLSRYSQDQQG